MHQRRAVLLLTIALMSAAALGARAQDPPVADPWEPAIQAFEQQDAAQPPPESPILFVGSSSIRMWDVTGAFPSHTVLNRGFGGSQIADATRFVDRIVTPYAPSAIFFYSGDNDVASGRTADQVVADFKAFVDAVEAALPDTPIFFISIKPSPSRWNLWETMDEANRRIRVYADDHPYVDFVDVATPMLDQYGRPRRELFQPDLLHLNDEGYAVWNAIVSPVLFGLAADGEDTLTVSPAPAGKGAVEILPKTPAEQGRRYAVAWEMSVTGEKAWRFRADFAGIAVRFYDAEGKSLQTIRRHTHAWETLGWQPCWILLDAPANAAGVSASMTIESADALPGQFHVRNVALHDISGRTPAEGHGLLHIVVTDGAGLPIPARLYVNDAAGKGFTPRYAFTADLGGPCFYFQDPEVNVIDLPPATYTVRALKGFDHEPAQAEIDVVAGEVHQVDLTLVDNDTLGGWVSGDHHVHLFRHGGSLFPMINLDDVYTIAKAEGLDYLPFMGADKVADARMDYSEPDFLAMVTEELTRDLWGHLCPIGVREWPRMADYGEAWPMNYYWIAAAEKAGGAIAYAHPYGPVVEGLETYFIADPEAGRHMAREFPIDVALDLHCTLDLLTKEDAAGDFEIKLRDYMRLLGLGFHIGATGSTDFHVDQARQPIGGIRTYAKAKLTWDSIAAAYREGRTFATNGPLIDLTVDGKGPGDTIKVSGPREVSCAVRAHSLWGVDNVELWHNGAPVLELAAVDGRIDETVAVPVQSSGWLLAIVRGAANPEVMDAPEGAPMVAGQYAITSPVYIAMAGHPTPVNADDVSYFIGWIDAVAEGVQKEIAAFEAAGGAVPADVREAIASKLLGARSAYARLGGSTGTKMDRLKALQPTERLLVPPARK